MGWWKASWYKRNQSWRMIMIWSWWPYWLIIYDVSGWLSETLSDHERMITIFLMISWVARDHIVDPFRNRWKMMKPWSIQDQLKILFFKSTELTSHGRLSSDKSSKTIHSCVFAALFVSTKGTLSPKTDLFMFAPCICFPLKQSDLMMIFF